MPGFIPALDQDSLASLRRLVQSMQQDQGPSLPMANLVQLAEEIKSQNGITVDFTATASLGTPMIVVQLPPVTQLAPALQVLSKREREVAALIAQVCSNKQIAKRLHISPATVKDHVHRMLRKTGLENRTAIALAFHETSSSSKSPLK